jgi:ubiquinone/menaquinone biosynthesis C-methylase UbiE
MNYDASQLPERYVAARTLPPATLGQWLDAVADAACSAKLDYIVDLGCGTGRFTPGLQGRLSANVIGIDPSFRMLSQAPRSPRVHYIQAAAEALPLCDRSIDLVFMSMVWHHIRSTQTAASEIRRVLKSRGVICVRTSTMETLDSCLYLSFFPAARRINEATIPSREALRAWAFDHGFDVERQITVVQEIDRYLPDYAARIARRGYSDLASITDHEFNCGVKELRRYCDGANPTQPIIEAIDFFVFRR